MLIPTINNIKKVDIEITNKCNARCPGCIRTVNGDTHPFLQSNVTEWSLEYFKSIISKDVVNGKTFILGNTVEDPLMNKNIVSIVEYILENNGRVKIYTNTGANTKETFAQLGKLSSKGTQHRLIVVFSVDGFENTNHLYRVNVKWNKVVENMVAYTNQKGECEWEYLVFDHNYDDIPLAQEFAKKLNIPFNLRQNVRNTRSWFSKTKVKEQGKITTKTFEVKPTTKFEHSETIKMKELNDDYRPMKGSITSDKGKTISCKMYHGRSVFVDWSSKVWPCCWFATENFEDHEYYHMLINEFGETWNNLKHHSWNEILGHKYYTNLLHESWNGSPSNYYNRTCFKQCGDNAARQSYKRQEL